MNKNDIKQIIFEEIEAALKEMGNSPEMMAADSRPEEDDITPPGIEDMSPDPIFGADPSYVEEEHLNEDQMKNLAKLLRDEADQPDNKVGKSIFLKYAAQAEKTDVKDIKSLLGKLEDELIAKHPDTFSGEDDIVGSFLSTSKNYTAEGQQYQFDEMPRTSNIFKLKDGAGLKDVLQFMQRVNDVLKTYKSPGQKRPKKRFTPEEMKALATAMVNPEGFTSKDVIAATSYNSPAQANKFLKALEMKGLITLTSQLKKAQEPTRDPDAPETRGRKRRDAEFDMADDPTAMDFGDFDDLDLGSIDALEENVSPQALIKVYQDEIKAAKENEQDDEIPAYRKGIEMLKKGGKPEEVNDKVQGLIIKLTGERGDPTVFLNKAKRLSETKTTMTNLEKYIKQQIKEAKNPLAQKMKEIEAQGRVAALETKLAALAEMIEETEGRLTRIDEDNEFRDMMDKKAVKEVRKQLKELERAQAKLQKEYDKIAEKGRKKANPEEPVMGEEAPMDEEAIDSVVDEVELEEDDMALSESVKRMQKLANLKG